DPTARARAHPRHARPHDPQDALLGADARPRRAPLDRAGHPRAAPDRGRRALPGAAPDGTEGVARGGVGIHRRGAQGQVLPPQPPRPRAAHRGALAMGALHPRRRPRDHRAAPGRGAGV
ncbi:MAG: Transcriptional regulator, PadR family, partial [uncultured Gemmatimonadaceae bacterium]